MKRIFVLLVLASAAVAAGAASCAINHRSGSFECETTADCASGRTCSEGLCVVTGGGPDGGLVDGPRPDAPPDAPVCPSQCTSCSDAKTCVIDCAMGAACNAPIVCPPGFNCTIRCNTIDSCRAGINCSGGTSCAIQCSGRRSCRGVTCGPGPCNVGCTGQFSCETVSCGQSCACDVTGCSFANSSCSNVQCTSFQCDTGLGCSSMQAPTCETCP